MKAIYVVGIQEPGVCALTNRDAYEDYNVAEEVLKKDREDGMKFTRIFELHVMSREEYEAKKAQS